ncbi:amino acid permease-associated region [Gemmatirosa kalamazoonensis]|uniref:Amino acid permease-associated region n=1 Tax=Gemmatirosa kalamazoonensis TaxID=861299 RepID=W0REB0_9BACT|nr:APC family permease [Gemmatirosa kalamazoonensis]AHG88670.1 amino acid permease-associated region [Gemmatirosa kalamazoonensis]
MTATEVRGVERHSAALRKELGLTDLVLTQILYVVGLSWVGTAAKLGTAQIAFWLAAMALFYLPQAAVVVHLSRRFPLEGGLYQWAKLGLGGAVAFLVAWNLWIYAIVLLGAFGIQVANAAIYAAGPTAAWLSGNRAFMGAVSGVLLAALVLVSIRGLSLSKWVHNVGSVLLLGAFALLVALPFIGLARGTLRSYHPFGMTAPALTLFNLNVFSKLAVGGLSGFEYAAVLAGEARDAERTIARSVIVAVPVIALMFMLGTSSVLALVPIDRIDLVGPIPQAFRAGFGALGGALGVVIPFAVFAVTARTIANSSVLFTATTRMPMVTGWDDLMPGWFARLHPRFRTPVNSILFVGACALVFCAAGMAGVGEQEAFQLLDNAAGIFYGLTYLVLFAVPLVGLRAAGRAPWWLRAAALAGFATSALYVVLSVVPIVAVESRLAFALKIGGLVMAANLLGATLYVRARRRAAAHIESVSRGDAENAETDKDPLQFSAYSASPRELDQPPRVTVHD